MSVTSRLAAIADVGRDRARGGYSRPVLGAAERELREWFVAEAEDLGLGVETDRNGVLWAWWGEPADGALVTGSHLDSVPGGGAFDGPLGVASALEAVALLQRRDLAPHRPLAVVVLPEEEGSRFGSACLGSRLLTGDLDPDAARALRDDEGRTLAEVFAAGGTDPRHLGRDPQALARIGTFVELHVEQGRGLVDLERPVGVASSILAHGRWRLTFTGEGNHAGATPVADRHDPVVPAARTVLAARAAVLADTAADPVRATVGRIVPVPGGSNVIASSASVWLDARAGDDRRTREVVGAVVAAARAAAAEEGCELAVVEESFSPRVAFDAALGRRLATALAGTGADLPLLATGAGHDAGVLSAHAPTAMLFVRNPTGVSHSPAEHVEDADAERGAEALATALAELL